MTTTRRTEATKLLEVKNSGKVKQNGHNDNKVSRIDVLTYGAHDDGNAECMKDLYGEQLIYSEALGWMYYTGTHWKDVSRAKAIQLATDTLKARLDAAIRANNESLMRATLPTRSNISDCVILYQSKVTVEDVSIFDSDPDLLNCLNGVVNLRTGSIEPHRYCQYLTYCIPIEYRRDADMSLWNDFIHQCADSEEVAHFLQLAVGYSFTGHTREEKFFYLYGPTRAGKGTFTETLMHLLGKPFAEEVDFDTFTAPRYNDNQNFDLAPLKATRFIVASESNRFQPLNSAKVKQMTGGNDIRCAFKHGTHFTYRPQFKVWMVSNFPLNADPDDRAVWSRPFVINFPKSHEGSEDVTLKNRLRKPENLEGILRWVVEGAMGWYQQGKLTAPSEVVQSTKEHRDSQDTVMQWLEDGPQLVEKVGNDYVKSQLFKTPMKYEPEYSWESTSDVTKSYKAWCIDNNIKPVHPQQLASSLVRLGLISKRKPKTGTRGYKRLISESDRVTGGDDDFPETPTGTQNSVQVESSVTPRHPVTPSENAVNALVERLPTAELIPDRIAGYEKVKSQLSLRYKLFIRQGGNPRKELERLDGTREPKDFYWTKYISDILLEPDNG